MRRTGLVLAAVLGGVLAGGSNAGAARIVYVVDDDEISTTLSSVLPNGKRDRVVTSTGAYDDEPSWGPSHHRVAFDRGKRVWIVRADGTHSHAVPHTKGGLTPSWSPDARKLVFSIRRHKASLSSPSARTGGAGTASRAGSRTRTTTASACTRSTRRAAGRSPTTARAA
jgi:hypothetical protein